MVIQTNAKHKSEYIWEHDFGIPFRKDNLWYPIPHLFVRNSIPFRKICASQIDFIVLKFSTDKN